MEEITTWPATRIAAAVRAGEVSAAEVVAAHLARIEAVNPAVNAVVQVCADAATEAAAAADATLQRGDPVGPLHGVPVTIKDCFATAGVPVTAGTVGRRDYVIDADDVQVSRLREAGAIVLGKTNLPELLMAWESDNLVYGRTSNPYDLERTCGGSSGGEAAAIASCCSPLGLGSDSGGSIRVPAAYCGVAGLKPTPGRVPLTSAAFGTSGPMRPLRGIGPMARTVADLALMMPVLCGPDGHDWTCAPVPWPDPVGVDVAGLRVGLMVDNGLVTPTPAIVAAVEAAGVVLADRGAVVTEAVPPGAGGVLDHFLALAAGDGGGGLRLLLGMMGTTETSPLLERMAAAMAEYPAAATGTDLLIRFALVDAWRGEVQTFWDDHDLLVCPTVAAPAVEHGTCQDHLAHYSYAALANVAGWPAATVPAGLDPDGLPVGVHIAAPPWHDDIVLAAAAHVEEDLGGWEPPPIA